MMKRFRMKRFALMMSILLIGVASMPAETDEPGPFERLFRAMRRGLNEPHHKSTSHRSSRKQTDTETKNSSSQESNTQTAGSGAGAPPSDRNTRTASRAPSKKGEDLRYG